MIKLAANLSRMIKASEKNRFDTGPVTERHLDYTPSSAGDYALYGSAGALGGAGLGALINYLRDKSLAEGALLGAGLGGVAGLGTRGVMDTIKTRELSLAEDRPGGMKDTLRNVTGGGQTGNPVLDMILSKNPRLAQAVAQAVTQGKHDKGLDVLEAMQKYQAGGGMGGAGDTLDPGVFNAWQDEQNLEKRRAYTMDLQNQGPGQHNPAELKALQSSPGMVVQSSAPHKRAASSASDYALYGGGGALGGAGLGALINYLRDKSVAQGALVGGGIGGAAGLGTRGLMDYLANAEAKAAPTPEVNEQDVAQAASELEGAQPGAETAAILRRYNNARFPGDRIQPGDPGVEQALAQLASELEGATPSEVRPILAEMNRLAPTR